MCYFDGDDFYWLENRHIMDSVKHCDTNKDTLTNVGSEAYQIGNEWWGHKALIYDTKKKNSNHVQ